MKEERIFWRYPDGKLLVYHHDYIGKTSEVLDATDFSNELWLFDDPYEAQEYIANLYELDEGELVCYEISVTYTTKKLGAML
jgi:hypothetical protein